MVQALQHTESIVLRDTLVSFASVQAAVPFTADPTKYKVFWRRAHPSIEMPMILMTRIAGGWVNKAFGTNSSDSIWKIWGFTNDEGDVSALLDGIAELHETVPIVTGVTDVTAYAEIEEVAGLYEDYLVQNVIFYRVGGLYRIRLVF